MIVDWLAGYETGLVRMRENVAIRPSYKIVTSATIQRHVGRRALSQVIMALSPSHVGGIEAEVSLGGTPQFQPAGGKDPVPVFVKQRQALKRRG